VRRRLAALWQASSRCPPAASRALVTVPPHTDTPRAFPLHVIRVMQALAPARAGLEAACRARLDAPLVCFGVLIGVCPAIRTISSAAIALKTSAISSLSVAYSRSAPSRSGRGLEITGRSR